MQYLGLGQGPRKSVQHITMRTIRFAGPAAHQRADQRVRGQFAPFHIGPRLIAEVGASVNMVPQDVAGGNVR